MPIYVDAVRMRLALLIAPSDPRAGDAASRRESLAWLRGQFARAKFDVAIVGAAQSPEEAMAKAASSIRAGDTVTVHVSGRLVGREGLAFGGGRSASLSRLREALAARQPAELSFVADVTYEDDPSAPATAEERLAWAVGALGAESHGHAVLAAVRRDAGPAAAGRMAFTRVAMSALPSTDRNAAPQSVESLLAAMYAAAMGLPEGRTAADHVLLRRGASTSGLAPMVAEFAVVSVPLAAGSPARGAAPDAVEGSLSAAAQLAVEPLPSSPLLAATLDDIEAAASRTPMHAPLYASAYEIHLRDGNTDLAVLAAMALEQLEAAAVEQRALVGRFRSVGPVRARAPLDAEGWALLQAPGFDDVISALFAAVEGAAIAVALEDGRDEREHPETAREHRLSETSTASVVRTFQWASRFLGVRCPDLYAVDDPPGILSIRASEPSTVLGGAVLSGRSAKDLAFLAARHLTFYRPEHHVLLYYPTREALTALLFAGRAARSARRRVHLRSRRSSCASRSPLAPGRRQRSCGARTCGPGSRRPRRSGEDWRLGAQRGIDGSEGGVASLRRSGDRRDPFANRVAPRRRLVARSEARGPRCLLCVAGARGVASPFRRAHPGERHAATPVRCRANPRRFVNRGTSVSHCPPRRPVDRLHREA
jgi:hypothetical protein